MKRIVLSEGKRDVALVENFYALSEPDIKVDTFIGEEKQYSRLKSQETDKIRNFLEPRNPYQVLAKSENGKEDLKLVFIKLANFLCKFDADVCIVIDLDGGEYNALIAELDERVHNNFRGKRLGVDHSETIQRNTDMRATILSIHSDGSPMKSIEMISFHSNLEEVVGLKKDETDEEETEIIQEFLKNRCQVQPVTQVLSCD